MSEHPLSRRTFVGQLAGTAAAFTIVPRHVLGRGYQAPSDTLNVACVGVGGKGRTDVEGLAGENVYALCDVDARMAEASFNAHPKAKRYTDWRELLVKEAKNIDAVMISTPDHTHAVVAMAALKAGKHVFCQKPLARTLDEVRALRAEARRRPKQATQMGNQGHAGDGTRKIRELVEAGAIGTVRELHYWTNRPIWPQAIDRPVEAFNPPPWFDWDLWLGPAPERPYAPAYAPFRWRGWWDYGTGALGDIGCHSLDAAFWALDLGTPARIEAETTRQFPETAPRTSRIIYDFPARGARGPIRAVWRDGELAGPRPAGLPEQYAWPAGYSDVGTQLWIGSDGMLIADVYGDKPMLLDAAKRAAMEASPPPEKYPRSPGIYNEWIAAAKAGAQPSSNFGDHAAALTEMVLLGNLAVRTGQPVTMNPSTGAVMSAGVPRELLGGEYRKGWTL